MDETQRLILEVIENEIDRATGCTDPGAVALAASRAIHELKGTPERAVIEVSRNIYKNGVNVGIPGCKKRGLQFAAALGCFLDKSSELLNLLDFVTPEIIQQADSFTKRGCVALSCVESSDPLYVKAEIFSEEESASAVIQGDYTNIVSVVHNGKVVFLQPNSAAKKDGSTLNQYRLKDLYEEALSIPGEKLRFLVQDAGVNQAAAQTGLDCELCCLGRKYHAYSENLDRQPEKAIRHAQSMTAAAGEARMMGLPVPIMAISGSGNHGITNFLGVQSVAEQIHADEEHYIHALVISSMVTVYIKGFIKRMTAFCGCSVAAATGVAAASVYLLGGTFDQAVTAMQSLIGTLGGMLCDGAKESCAYKLSTATAMGIQFAYLALDGCGLKSGIGILGNTIEDTFYNLGQLNDPGMVETDKVIVQLMERTAAQKRPC